MKPDPSSVRRARLLCGVALLGFVPVASSGCASSDAIANTYTVRTISHVEWEEVFNASEATLVELGFEIERHELVRGVLVCRPVAGKAGDPVGGAIAQGASVRRRRLAEVRLQRSPDGVRTLVKVAVQERVGATYRLLTPGGGDADGANATPSQRDAATTAAQNSAWGTVTRDRALENAIVQGVLARTVSKRPGGSEG